MEYFKVWSVEREELLKTLWAAGSSAREIAVEMNCSFSRSAVLGKIHRMKLPWPDNRAPRDVVIRHKEHLMPRRAPQPKPAQYTSPPRRNQHNSFAEKIAIAAADPGLSERLKGDAPDGTGIKLHQLTARTCRFPFGDPKTPEFEFCGARSIKGLPYCAGHCRIAFQFST